MRSERTNARFCGDQCACNTAPAPHADYYQAGIQVEGADTDFRLAGFLAEPDEVVEGIPASATVNLKRRAVNETGPEVTSLS